MGKALGNSEKKSSPGLQTKRRMHANLMKSKRILTMPEVGLFKAKTGRTSALHPHRFVCWQERHQGPKRSLRLMSKPSSLPTPSGSNLKMLVSNTMCKRLGLLGCHLRNLRPGRLSHVHSRCSQQYHRFHQQQPCGLILRHSCSSSRSSSSGSDSDGTLKTTSVKFQTVLETDVDYVQGIELRHTNATTLGSLRISVHPAQTPQKVPQLLRY